MVIWLAGRFRPDDLSGRSVRELHANSGPGEPLMFRFAQLVLLAFLGASLISAADAEHRLKTPTLREFTQPSYYWKSTPVGDTAELLTLFCRSCETSLGVSQDVPLVAALRDTLGDTSAANDRVTCIWLLSYTRPNWRQRLLSAVPFFYWRVGAGSEPSDGKRVAPLMDLTDPQHRVLSAIGRDVLQWTTLDPMNTPIRATSRAYRTNEVDHERLHLEEAISYLRNAPVSSDATGLTRTELDTVVARLELRKKLLGGFVTERQAAQVGKEASFAQERIRSRNWELLRQCADRTGLLFEPLNLVSDSQQYAILWFPLAEAHQPADTALGAVWKLLNIKNPWTDARLKNWNGPTYERDVDASGGLLSSRQTSDQVVRVIPLGVYSLNYPKTPLLLIDFRDKMHIRRHELAQRSINEITSGVIGISHFTNWYYYVAADLYDFVMSRRGTAMDQSERLDCYSQFRVALALDRQLDPTLRKEMQQRISSLAVNPLETAPEREIRAAATRYTRLQEEAGPEGALASQVDKDRRSELASFGQGRAAALGYELLHLATLSHFTHRSKPDTDDLVALDCYRRVQSHLHFLDSLVQAGTPPEVAYSSANVRAAVTELDDLMPRVRSESVRTHARNTLEALGQLSQDPALQAECSGAANALNLPNRNRDARPGAAPGVVASPLPQTSEALR
ncbi:MAG TPA: hypothetical protein VH601_09690 [Bryobacteraceae bacterium]|jgi:hypothetical protein